MLHIGSIAVMFLGVSPVIAPQIHQSEYANAVSISRIQQIVSKVSKMDIAQNYDSNCDRIRQASNLYKLGLSQNEIEQLGANQVISMNDSRLERIHNRLMSNPKGQPKDSPMEEGQEGDFWFFDPEISALPQNSNPAQVAQKTKSITDSSLNRKIPINKLADFAARSKSGVVGFTYNFRNRNCWVLLSLNCLAIDYPGDRPPSEIDDC